MNAIRITLITLAALTGYAQQPTIRKSAPDFVLKDAADKTATLQDYRGQVVLLNFWATWCGGCKQEMPCFEEFQTKYGAKGLAVVGVSLDDAGWSVVKPFLAETKISYRMLLGNQPTAEQYGIKSLPVTLLIDRQGRVAASYTGIVDKDDVEANIKAILAKR